MHCAEKNDILGAFPWYTVSVILLDMKIVDEYIAALIDFISTGISLIIRFIVPAMLVFFATNCFANFTEVKKLLLVTFLPLPSSFRTMCSDKVGLTEDDHLFLSREIHSINMLFYYQQPAKILSQICPVYLQCIE